MHTLDRFLAQLQLWMKRAGAVCLIAMAGVTGADIIGRFFDHPIFGSEEIVTMLATLTVGLALPYAHAEKSHIGVELFLRFIPKRIRRTVKFSTDLAAMLLFAIITWRMTDYAFSLRRSGEVSMNLELPEYWVVFVLAFGFLAFTLAVMRDVLEYFLPAAAQDGPAETVAKEDA